MTERAGFFAVDRHAWARVCDLGVNPAVAYLLLASGTGGDNRTTSWSVKAVEGRTAISRPRAKRALEALEAASMMVVLNRGTRPRYKLSLASDIPGSKVFLSEQDNELVLEVCKAGLLPMGRRNAGDKKRAARLAEIGWLVASDRGYTVPPENELPKPSLLWLPNALANGLNGETPPIEILRQSSSIDAIRMFINLYADHDIRHDAGLPWRRGEGIHYAYERTELNRRAEYVVWGFGKRTGSAWPSLYAASEHRRVRGGWDGFWDAIDILVDAGVLQFVAHLVNTAESQGEVIHPLPLNPDAEAVEWRITQEATRAAKALLESSVGVAHLWAIAPVLRHFRDVQLVGIGRLRYRPHTRATDDWIAKRSVWEGWASGYSAIADKALGVKPASPNVATSRTHQG